MPPTSHLDVSGNLKPANKRVVWKPVLSTPFLTSWPELSSELSNEFLEQLLQLLDSRQSSDPHLIPTQPDHQSQSVGLNIAQYRNHQWCQKRGRKPLDRSRKQAHQPNIIPAPNGQSPRPNKIHGQKDKKRKLSHSIHPSASSQSIKDAIMHQDSPVGSTTATSTDKEKSKLLQTAAMTSDIEMKAEHPAPPDVCVLEPNLLTTEDDPMDGTHDSSKGLPQSGDMRSTSPDSIKECLQPFHYVRLRSDKVVAIPDFISPEQYKHTNTPAGGAKRKRPPLTDQRPALLDHAVIGINDVTKSLELEIAQATHLSSSGQVAGSKLKGPTSRSFRTSTRASKSAKSNKSRKAKDAKGARDPTKKPQKLAQSISEIIDTLLDARLPTDSMSFQWAEVSRMQPYQHNPRNRVPYQPRRKPLLSHPSDRVHATSLAQLPRSSTWFPRFNVTQAQLIEDSTVDPVFTEAEAIDLPPFTHAMLVVNCDSNPLPPPWKMGMPLQGPDLSKHKQHPDILFESRLIQSAIGESYRSIFNYYAPDVVRAVTIKNNHICPHELQKLSVKKILKLTELKNSVRYIKPRIPAAQISCAPGAWIRRGENCIASEDDVSSDAEVSGAQDQVDQPVAPTALSATVKLEPFSEPSRLQLIFVCKEDLNPSTLVDHLLATVATLNHHRASKKRLAGGEEEDDDEPSVYLVPLPKGAERRVAGFLGIKRAAVVAFPETTPGLSKLSELAKRFVQPMRAPYVGRSVVGSAQPKVGLTGGTTLGLIPTHIKHCKSTAPIDMRKAKADKAERRKARRKNKTKHRSSGDQRPGDQVSQQQAVSRLEEVKK